ncbi:unnamed protein product [Cuscuta campestris]|uniref:Uncharacterized protein n=1 Tax=Cuscuta campestris TaxID=132261 RepID=A0A484MR83_9ASTE|nr:unnamed protein product [Cuscuta campestris]
MRESRERFLQVWSSSQFVRVGIARGTCWRSLRDTVSYRDREKLRAFFKLQEKKRREEGENRKSLFGGREEREIKEEIRQDQHHDSLTQFVPPKAFIKSSATGIAKSTHQVDWGRPSGFSAGLLGNGQAPGRPGLEFLGRWSLRRVTRLIQWRLYSSGGAAGLRIEFLVPNSQYG